MFSIVRPDFGRYRTDLIMDQFPLAATPEGEMPWFPQRVPHLYIDGPLASGKTTTAQNLVIAACRAGWDVHVLRQFSREYREFEDWPGVKIASTPTEHVELLLDTTGLQVRGGRRVGAPTLLVIDTRSLLADIGNDGLDQLRNLVDTGPARRINLVLVSDPTGSDVEPALTRQLHHVELESPFCDSKVLRPPREISQWQPAARPE